MLENHVRAFLPGSLSAALHWRQHQAYILNAPYVQVKGLQAEYSRVVEGRAPAGSGEAALEERAKQAEVRSMLCALYGN